MTASGYALIGRSFPSEIFEGLYQASVATRRQQGGGLWSARRPLPAQSAWLTARRPPVFPAATR